MRLFVVVIVAASLAGCVNVEKSTKADGSSCQNYEFPLFHYSDCTPAPSKAGT